MSFALDFRRKHFLEPARLQRMQEAAAAVARPIPPVGHRAGERQEPRSARGAAFAALLIAAAILAVFNSEGMTSYARDLAEMRAGRPLLIAAERWDGAMEKIGAKRLVANVRNLMLDAQYARWSDVAGVFGLQDDPMTAEMPDRDELYTGALPEERR